MSPRQAALHAYVGALDRWLADPSRATYEARIAALRVLLEAAGLRRNVDRNGGSDRAYRRAA